MTDTKKEWKNTPLAEKIFKIFVNIGVLLIAAVLPYFAYFVSPENSWPANWVANDPAWLDALCWTVYAIGAFILSGLWAYIPGIDDDEDPWKNITISAVIGMAAAIFTMILV
jgi:hypothetical protein